MSISPQLVSSTGVHVFLASSVPLGLSALACLTLGLAASQPAAAGAAGSVVVVSVGGEAAVEVVSEDSSLPQPARATSRRRMAMRGRDIAGQDNPALL